MKALENAVFGVKDVEIGEEKAPKKKQERKLAWIDPDDVADIPAPTGAEGEGLTNKRKEKFNLAFENVDVSWATKKSEVQNFDASEIFANIHNQIPSETLTIDRVADLYVSQSKAGIIQISFSPTEERVAILDSKGMLHIVSVNGKNNKIQCQFPFSNEPPRFCMTYTANGEQIIVCGGRGVYHTVDLRSQTTRVTPLSIYKTDIKKVYCSPDNKFLIMLTEKRIHFIDNGNKALRDSISTTDDLICGTFTDDAQYFIACGSNGRGLLIDVEAHNPICRFQEPEMQHIHAVAISNNLVAMGTDAGILHVFSFDSLKTQYPKPLFSKMNLTTKIDTVVFNSTGELIVFGSSGKKDSMRILHVGSQKVYPNWPTQNTPISYLRDAKFDGTSQYLAFGNEKGKVLLFQIPFYLPK